MHKATLTLMHAEARLFDIFRALSHEQDDFHAAVTVLGLVLLAGLLVVLLLVLGVSIFESGAGLTVYEHYLDILSQDVWKQYFLSP